MTSDLMIRLDMLAAPVDMINNLVDVENKDKKPDIAGNACLFYNNNFIEYKYVLKHAYLMYIYEDVENDE
jgi:hypothetical protein